MKKIKIKYRNIIILLIFIFLIIILFISLKHIYQWFRDNKKTDVVISEIEEIVEVKEVEDSEETEIIEQTEEIDEFNPYWDYINMNLIDVEFSDLYQENSDIVGWIQVNGTNINYPFVQTDNNSFYLTHSFNKNKNSAGWVFLDYRNNVKELDKNNIIYAHGRVNGTMFGSLRNILESKWLDNSNNYVIKLSTEYANTLWQVFSVYHIPTTNDYIQIDFKNNDAFFRFANMLKERSDFDFNTTIDGNDKILTLSTCYSDTEKVVLHAKLIKQELKK